VFNLQSKIYNLKSTLLPKAEIPNQESAFFLLISLALTPSEYYLADTESRTFPARSPKTTGGLKE
jgi:hypothetical protein